MAVEFIIAPEVERGLAEVTHGTKRGGLGWKKSF
jgi:hypothetical protein